ncbi:hypothetical protein N7456_005497 [Penicillium angulare]|uniref:MYND-type domain-containing protein n=1 Tax=Penicillium angulare TaxID=116970 RepID=A0A9W9FYL8_9EURO|nr:hypothetical protein N7456_005497 [Penicillium angulare]
MAPSPVPSGCGVCGMAKQLILCTGCQAMPYCSQEHQDSHEAHKTACHDIQDLKRRIEMAQLQFQHGNRLVRYSLFANSRQYMDAHWAVFNSLGRVHCVQSLEAQLDHATHMLKSSFMESFDTASIIPEILLRLDRDQECYAFVRWWKTKQKQYQWDNADFPVLSSIEVDPLESVAYFGKGRNDVFHLTCVALLKVKLILDVLRLQQSTRTIGLRVPKEILDLINTYVPRSPIVSASRDLIYGSYKNRWILIAKLESQVKLLYQLILSADKNFWDDLMKTKQDLIRASPDPPVWGHTEVRALLLRRVCSACVEIPGTVDYIRALVMAVDSRR